LATVALDGCVAREGDPHDLAPTVSTSVALALGDALAVTLMVARGFGPDDFKTFHPGGSLGRLLDE
jgi:arabinose-5-phosphate isomerase